MAPSPLSLIHLSFCLMSDMIQSPICFVLLTILQSRVYSSLLDFASFSRFCLISLYPQGSSQWTGRCCLYPLEVSFGTPLL